MKVLQKAVHLFAALITLALAGSSPISAQVQSEVPPVIPNARPATLEHI